MPKHTHIHGIQWLSMFSNESNSQGTRVTLNRNSPIESEEH